MFRYPLTSDFVALFSRRSDSNQHNAVAGDGCSCNSSSGPCPASFTVGDECSRQGLACPWPGSKCGRVVCTCENGPSAFYWTCPSSWCTCTCPCGYSGRVSCESLDCNAQPTDTCPASEADTCALVCADAGRPDARPDARRDRPAGESRPVDGARDSRIDAPPDRAADRAGDRAADQATDGRRDRAGNDRGTE